LVNQLKELLEMKQKINIKPLSVNCAYTGKRYKTDNYKWFENELLFKLKSMNVPKGKLTLITTFGLSSLNADWDNPVKPFQDVLQKKYGFNDRMIYRGIIEKVDVAKGDEFIEFEIVEFEG